MRHLLRWCVVALTVAVLLGLAAAGWRSIIVHLSQETGTSNEASRAYAWWSGFGSVIVPPLLSVAGIAFLAWWHHNCHTSGCLRVARHTTPDGYKLCRRCLGKPKSALGLHFVHEDHR